MTIIKGIGEAAEAASDAARLLHGEKDVARVATDTMPPSALDAELGAAPQPEAPDILQQPMPEYQGGQQTAPEGAQEELTAPPPNAPPEGGAPSEEPPATGEAPPSPAQEAQTGENLADLNPFAQAVNDPTSLAAPPIASGDLRQQMQSDPSEHLSQLGRVNGMNLRHFNDPKDKQLVNLINMAQEGYFERHSPQVKTWAQTEELSLSRETLEKALGMRVNQKWETEDLKLLEGTLKAQAQELHALGKRIDEIESAGSQADGELLAAYLTREQKFIATKKTLEGALTEAARIMNIARSFNEAGSNMEYFRMVANSIEAGGGRSTVVERARMFSKDDVDLAQANNIIRESLFEKTVSAAYRIRYAMMLSSVRTHAANFFGSQVMGIVDLVAQQPAAGMFNFAEYIAREVIPFLEPMKPEERMRYFQELPTQIAGIVTGGKEGIQLAYRIATGKEMPKEGKFINEMGYRFDPAAAQGGTVKRLASAPLIALEAEDAFNKSVFYRMKLNQLALRQSRALPDGQGALYKDMLMNPPDWMHEEAMLYAKRLTLSNDPNYYGKLVGGVATTLAAADQNIPAFKVIVPFIRTPANSVGYAFHNSGLGGIIAPKQMLDTFTKGTPAERADFLGRMTIAAGLWGLVYNYWQEGKITGASSVSPDVRLAYEATGWQENSVLVNGKYYSLSRTDPLGMQLIIVAGGLDAFHSNGVKDKFTTFLATMLSLVQISQDRSALSGLNDFFDLLKGENKMKTAESMAASIGASFVFPAWLRDVRSGTDEYRRDMAFDPAHAASGIVDRFEKYIQNATPSLSKNLPPAVDINGEYIRNDGSVMWRSLVPINVSAIKDTDPVAATYLLHRTSVRHPDFLISIPKSQVQLNLLEMDNGKGWLYHEYKMEVGMARHEQMMKFLSSATWKKLVKADDIGQGSTASMVIETALANGLKVGQSRFLKRLSTMKEYQPNVNGVAVGEPFEIAMPYNREDIRRVSKGLRANASQTEALIAEGILDTEIYRMKRRSKADLNLPVEQTDMLPARKEPQAQPHF